MTANALFTLLNQKSVQFIFDIFEHESKEICLVGGCVRDSLLGKFPKDFDIAANITPNEIIAILKKNNLNYEDYAYRYGSITTYINNQKFQITTLRQDINQIGRHTNIIFTQDWKKDALRRDFTINAMYLSRNGKIKDFFNGKEDLDNCTIKFIGNIENRIQEDFLRIYRYFRFLSIFENPKINREYEKVLMKYCQRSFDFLSNDLIRQEILKIFDLPFPSNSFFKDKKVYEKKHWVDLTKKNFIEKEYKIGLNNCLNKIDSLIT
jgi:poly(A) polymerase